MHFQRLLKGLNACADHGSALSKPSGALQPCRGSLDAHPCAYNEFARIVRATLRAFPSCPRRG